MWFTDTSLGTNTRRIVSVFSIDVFRHIVDSILCSSDDSCKTYVLCVEVNEVIIYNNTLQQLLLNVQHGCP